MASLGELIHDKGFLIATGLVAGVGFLAFTKNNRGSSASYSDVDSQTNKEAGTLFIPTSYYNIDYTGGNKSVESTVDNSVNKGGMDVVKDEPKTPTTKPVTYHYTANAKTTAEALKTVAQKDQAELVRKAMNNIKVTNPAYQDEWDIIRQNLNAEIERKALSGIALTDSSSAYNNKFYQSILSGAV